MNNNPLLQDFTIPPFSAIETEHFIPALKEAIYEGKKEIEAIKNDPSPPSFATVSLALEHSGQRLEMIDNIFYNLNSANSNSAMQKVAKEFSPLVTEYNNDILLDEKLFQKVSAVYKKRDQLELRGEDRRLVEKQYRSFVRSGALLGEGEKEKLRKIDQQLVQLQLRFGDNLLASTKDYKLVLSREEEVAGLPSSVLEMATALAKEEGLEGKWVFTLDYPSFVPFMKYAENRHLREKLFRAFGRRGCEEGEWDNRDIIGQIARLRKEKAQLLGYSTHAHLVLEERMAKNPQKVQSFLEELLQKARPHALKELDRLKEFAKENGHGGELMPWDGAYWGEKLRKSLFDLDDEVLRPYFQLEKVISGVFQVAKKLYGISFQEDGQLPRYHQEVKAYKVVDEGGEFLGIFYADFFPRPGKRNGAWMTSYRDQFIREGVDNRPIISIVCNFTRPTPSAPSLLTFEEVKTLFHEFGHALHGLLSKCHHPSLSGTSVYWDFVELPSQIMENWTYQKECLDLFAVHFSSGEKIPSELVKRVKEAGNFQEGMFTLRQLQLAFLDMAWHFQLEGELGVENLAQFEEKAKKSAQVFPPVEGIITGPSFGHIFQGGYSAGYYSYKWAEVLDADAFEMFEEEGIFNRETARRFRKSILERGGSEEPDKLYQLFRQQDAKIEALLRRGGLV